MPTNYRSTSEILGLANVIVNGLKKLFPGMIEKMDTEKSNKRGPKAIIVRSFD